MRIKELVNNIKNLTKDQFEALQLISGQFITSSYEESLIEDSLDWVIDILNAERALFAAYDENTNSFYKISARHIKKENVELSEFSAGILNVVLEKKMPVILHDAQGDPSVSQFKSVLLKRIKSVLGVPIFRDKKVWGIILADSQSNRIEFSESNLLFLGFFSNLVSLGLDRIIQIEKLRDENRILQNKVESIPFIPEMVGESAAMKELSKMIRRVAASDATVLILGESGTGKDLAAQAIHKLSSRSNKSYLAQFCGSIPDSLLESELFGYKKGAFTGAQNDKKGLLEVAEGGSFFLDEIADISSALQAKLLRVLENKEIIRLGDVTPKKINVRVISATNKNLETLVKNGTFREDLFYRLNVVPIKIPPLRERKEDISLLAEHFIKKFGSPEIKLTDKALLKLESHYWPGNVRQLLNIIQRALVLCDTDHIREEHIVIDETKKKFSYAGTLRDFESELLLNRLEELGGNRTQTAASLGVSVRWIQLKLKELGIQ